MKLYYVRLIHSVPVTIGMEPVYELHLNPPSGPSYSKYCVHTLSLVDGVVFFSRDNLHGIVPMSNVSYARYKPDDLHTQETTGAGSGESPEAARRTKKSQGNKGPPKA
jgi:hypothetical protein